MKRLLILTFTLWMTGVFWAQHYVVYPIPQSQELTGGKVNVTRSVNIVAESGIDKVTIDRACEVFAERGLQVSVSPRMISGRTNLLLGLNGSQGLVDREAARQELDRRVFGLPKYDRHIVCLSSDSRGRARFLVLGETTDAVFCGLATIDQMLDCGLKELPCVCFYDYADVRSRGVIEGYYGVPYNAEVTKDLFRFMARYKMNTYMYGAKSDPYHTRYWGDPYPTSITSGQKRIGYLTQDMLRDIVGVAHASKVNFIWAIHPGTAFTDAQDETVINRIMTKFQSMYDLGVRQFGVFVDDVGVPSDEPSLRLGADRLTRLQERIDHRWNRQGVSPADTVKPLQYVPQLYAFSWVSREVAGKFFASLANTPRKTDIYITGRNVWSVPNGEDLAIVREWLGRETAWWWNYPCNDNDVTKFFPMDMYTNFCDERHIQNDARMERSLRGTSTLIANPMQQGEVSKIALFSMGDFAWNNRAFDYRQSWLAALPAVVGKERAEALERVAPLLRYYDEDALAQLVADYKTSVEKGSPQPETLLRKLKETKQACDVLDELAVSPKESHRLFYEDIRPWLAKLETMLTTTILLLEKDEAKPTIDFEENPDFQFEILTGLGEDIALDVKTAEPSARILRPFIDWLIGIRRTPQ